MKKIYVPFLLLSIASASFAQWQQLPQKPESAKYRWGAFVFSIGNKLYYGGGATGGDIATQGHVTCLKDFYEYDIQSRTWSKKNDLPGVIAFGSSFSIDGKGYVQLGNIIGNFSVSHVDSGFWEYDPTVDSWSRKSDYPGGYYGSFGEISAYTTSFVINHKAYVGNQLQFYQFDPIIDKWITKNKLPTDSAINPGATISSFTIDSFGYLIYWDGGSKAKLWQFNPSTDSWVQKRSFPGANRTNGIAFALKENHKTVNLINHTIDTEYVLNLGYAGLGIGDRVFGDLYRYNPEKDMWIGSGFGGSPRQVAIATTVGDTVYIGDGGDATQGPAFGNFINDWWSFTPPDAIILAVKMSNPNSTIRCYPQPAKSEVNVSGLEENYNYPINIYDALGRKIHSSSISGADPRIDISHFSSGMYNLILQNGKVYIPLQLIKD